jgi:predicted kinase
MLVILSGLPGVGKTTIARALAREVGAVHLRIDSIELALGTSRPIHDEGYRVAYALAEDNLRLGRLVIGDSVNPWPLTRAAWQSVAERAGVPSLDVEIVCSDLREHQRRIETRPAEPGSPGLTWQDVVDRDYRPWDGRPEVVIDTARSTVEEGVRAIRAHLPTVG